MLDLSKYSLDVIEFFEDSANEVSKEVGFVKRERELSGSLFLKGVVFSQMSPVYASLEKTCETINEINPKVSINPQSLEERYTEASVKFLENMFNKAMVLSEVVDSIKIPILQCFTEVNILDSCEWQLPEGLKKIFKGSSGGASDSAIKVQLLLEFLSGSYKLIELTDRRKPDHTYGEEIIPHIKEDSLNLFDLGYFRVKFFKDIESAGGYYLCKLRNNRNLYETTQSNELKKINLDRMLRLSPKKLFSFRAIMKDSDNNSVKVTVICQPVSRKIAIKRRKKLRARAKGDYFPSKSAFYRASWNILITNIPEELLSVDEVLSLYSVRWEIEIVFKLWKSVCAINKVLTGKIHRFLTELYGKLIGMILGIYLFCPIRSFIMDSKKREISLLKSFTYLKLHYLEFAKSLNSKFKLLDFFCNILNIVSKFALLTQRTKKPRYKQLDSS